MKPIKGSIVAMVTPFKEDESVDFKRLEQTIEYQIKNGTDGILVLGTTGESTTMTHEEDDEVARFTIEKVNGRIPVIVGAGSNSTQTQLEKSIKYSKMGADALLLISPYYNKANTQGMIRHFTVCADAVDCPVILYNIPGRTGCSISEEVVKVLSKHPNICGIKEASGNISYATSIARYLSDDFAMYSGNDDMITSLLSIGASGVISVLSNILPKQTHDMVSLFHEGKVKESLQLQLKYLDVIHALFCEVNPIPVKKALNLMGLEVGPLRMPLTEMTEANTAKLAEQMKKFGISVL